MSVARDLPADPSLTDHFVYLRDVPWDEYERLVAVRGDCAVPRITYLEGLVELMSPSRHHETDKKMLARLLEAWADETGVVLEGYGSWTLKSPQVQRGVEPDECYLVGRVASDDHHEHDRPDIAIEVVWTSGGIDKLEVYRKLGVREVWRYQRGTLRFFALQGEAYAAIERSEVLPALDVALILRCMSEPSQTAAVQALRAAMRGTGAPR
jgi:Uma2 family endonuclease